MIEKLSNKISNLTSEIGTHSDTKPINLSKKKLSTLTVLGKGAESVVYKYSDRYLLKIFKSKIDLELKEEKIDFLIKTELPDYVVKPLAKVYVDDVFAGYKMLFIDGAVSFHELQKPKYVKENYISPTYLIERMIEVGEGIKELHQKGFILGDIRNYNFLLKDNKVYFIDVDSWGCSAKSESDKSNVDFLPDAYTDDYIPPYCYDENGEVNFSKSADMYGLAILAFNTITSLHPFDGQYRTVKNMTISDRMKKGISVLGEHDIVIPPIIPKWLWMTSELKNAFLDVFENQKNVDIIEALKEQIATVKYCSIHEIYYDIKKGCTLCAIRDKGVVSLDDNITKVSCDWIGEEVSLEAYFTNAKVILNSNIYIDNEDYLVNGEMGIIVPLNTIFLDEAVDVLS